MLILAWILNSWGPIKGLTWFAKNQVDLIPGRKKEFPLIRDSEYSQNGSTWVGRAVQGCAEHHHKHLNVDKFDGAQRAGVTSHGFDDLPYV